MINHIDVKTFDIEKFGEAIAKDAREGVKWEQRKLQWILEEKKRAEAQRASA